MCSKYTCATNTYECIHEDVQQHREPSAAVRMGASHRSRPGRQEPTRSKGVSDVVSLPSRVLTSHCGPLTVFNTVARPASFASSLHASSAAYTVVFFHRCSWTPDARNKVVCTVLSANRQATLTCASLLSSRIDSCTNHTPAHCPPLARGAADNFRRPNEACDLHRLRDGHDGKRHRHAP